MFVPCHDIRTVLSNLAENPNDANVSAFLSCLGSYPIDIWEDYLDSHILSRPQANPSANIINYRALSAMLVPNTLFEWVSWLKALPKKTKLKESLAFQEFIWLASQADKLAHKNLRKIIDFGISELLCELTNSYVSEKDYQNIEWLLIKERKQNIWYDEFNNYANVFIHQLPQILYKPRDTNNYSDYFYHQVTGTLRFLINSGWEQTRSEYENLAKLFARGKHHELSAVFYQISTASVPQDVLSNMTQMDLYKIPDAIPLSRKRSFWDKLWRVLRHLAFIKYILLFFLIIMLSFAIGFIAFNMIFAG